MAKDAQGRWTPTYTSPKAGASRTVDLDADLVDTLRWHRKAQEDERDERPGAYEDHGLVFAREDGSHLRPEYVSKLLPRLARTAGVPVIRLHDLRHTHAAILLSAGVPLFVVSKRLGHKTQAMTATCTDISCRARTERQPRHGQTSYGKPARRASRDVACAAPGSRSRRMAALWQHRSREVERFAGAAGREGAGQEGCPEWDSNPHAPEGRGF